MTEQQTEQIGATRVKGGARKRPGVVSIDALNDTIEQNPGLAARGARNPFSDYPVRLIEARYYTRDPRLDEMKKGELLDYCIRNEYFSREWVVDRGVKPMDKDQHVRVLQIKTDWDADQIRAFIDSKETHTFPSHHLVFCNIPGPKPGVPYGIALKSWITKRFRRVWFDLQWELPTPENPYREGEPNKCAIVDDDSIRAQLFFTREVKTGKVIPRRIGNGRDSMYMFSLLGGDAARSLEILRNIYTRGTRGSADLQLWEREGGLPSL